MPLKPKPFIESGTFDMKRRLIMFDSGALFVKFSVIIQQSTSYKYACLVVFEYITDVSIYGDQAAANVADMSGYSNAMNAVLGAAGMNPGNVQAALYNAYASGGTGTANGTAQLGSYDQSSSTYGPSRSGSGNRGYKPY